ncbi:dockerin type I domain-containing protein [Ruminococcus sp.]|uniref:dockerin type I domain-containing protein n=1 Tax=Ruminococcus sp. TaxID=41978 RepID=UPI002B9FF0A7|nr:dockerin type I domain-containing protein [Ruminococcus sp.]HOA00552.1 hypothetical protein [Ruminococcus sp.]
MKKTLTALMTAALMLASAAPVQLTAAAAETDRDSVIGTLPDWTPTNFAEAMQLYNKHGKCYVADNYICMMRIVPHFMKDDYKFGVSGSMTNINTPVSAGQQFFELEIPQKPDPDDIDAVNAYNKYCDSIGLYSHDYSFFENWQDCKTQDAFAVEMFRVMPGEDLTVLWQNKNNKNDDGEYVTTREYTFENKDGNTVETDIYSWLPDSVPEYDDFVMKYGEVSVHDNYIAYRTSYNPSGGASVRMEQSGEGRIEEFMESQCALFELQPVDDTPISSISSVFVYKPVADGMADVEWRRGRPFSDTESVASTTGKFEIKDNCSVVLNWSPHRKINTQFSFIDAVTGELIDIPDDDNRNIYLLATTQGVPATSMIFDITANPCIVDDDNAYSEYWSYSFEYASPAGAYEINDIELTSETPEYREVDVKLKWRPYGDVNGDHRLAVSDLVLVQRWLTGASDAELKYWEAADYCRDNCINSLDLPGMRRAVLKSLSMLVWPEKISTTNGEFIITGPDRKLYAGPGTEYEVLKTVPKGTNLTEYGYDPNSPDWVFAEITDTERGWVRVSCDGERNIEFKYELIDKPVIYLYPEEETDVHVELELTESRLSTTYPRYNGGWDITAYPGGSLLNKADGTHHRYLFWDSVDCTTRFDLSKGFCVAGADTESFLKEKLTYMGLTEDEMNEFIVYWLPRMEHNAYNLITFQGKAYTDTAKLDITPSPDSMLRVFMAYRPLEDSVDIEPQQLETFERKGFAVVEWGGTELS